MKKFIFSFVALLCTIFVASADQAGVKFFPGADQIVTPSIDYSEETQLLSSFAGVRTVGDVTVNMSNGLMVNGPSFNGAGSIVVSVPSGKQITKIELFPYGNAETVMAALSFSSGNATVINENQINWEGAATEVMMTFAASVADLDAPDGFNVYYGEGGSTVEPDPDPDPVTPPAEDGTVLIQTADVTMPSTPDMNLASCDLAKAGSADVNGLVISWSSNVFYAGLAAYPNDLQYGYNTGNWTLTAPAGTEIVEVIVKFYNSNYGTTACDATTVNTGELKVAGISSPNAKDAFVWTGATSEPLVFTINTAVKLDFNYITVVYKAAETPVDPPVDPPVVGKEGEVIIQMASPANDVVIPENPTLDLKNYDVVNAGSADADGVGISWTANVFGVGAGGDLIYGKAPGSWTLTPPAGAEITEVFIQFYTSNYGETSEKVTTVNTGELKVVSSLAGKSKDAIVWTGEASEPIVFTVGSAVYGQYVNFIKVVYKASETPVDPPVEKKIPAAVSDLAAAVDNAAKQVEVSFMLPTKYTDDSEIAAETEITATVVCGENNEVVTGTPGEVKKVTMAVADGTNKITVTTKVDEEENTEAAEISVYVGSVKPMPLTEVRVNASADHKSVTLSWDVPEGVDGGYIDPAEVTYTVRYKCSKKAYMFYTLEDVKGVTEFTYTPDIEDQDIYVFDVIAKNAMGSAAAVIGQTAVMLGNAVALPLTQSFAEDELIKNAYGSYTGPEQMFWGPMPVATYPGIGMGSAYFQCAQLSSKASAGWANTGVDMNQYGYIVDAYMPANGRIGSPFFSTVFGVNKVVTLKASIYKQCKSVKVVALTNGVTEPVLVAEVENNGWNNLEVELPDELMNQEYVQILFDTEFEATQYSHQYFALTSMAVDAATGVEAVSAQVAGIFGGEGVIVVAGHAGEEVAVATLDGRVVARMTASDYETVSLAAGVYVVRTDNGVAKVVVK